MIPTPKECCAAGSYDCQVPMPINGRVQGIDCCIADLVAALNATNLKTVASCCGHGDENIARIDLEDGRVLRLEGHTPAAEGEDPVENGLPPGKHCSDCYHYSECIVLRPVRYLTKECHKTPYSFQDRTA